MTSTIAILTQSHGFTMIVDVAGQVFVLFLVATAATFLLQRSSAAIRHRIWCLAFCGTLLVPLLAAAVPRWNWPVLPASADTLINTRGEISRSESSHDRDGHRLWVRDPLSQEDPAALILLDGHTPTNAPRQHDLARMLPTESARSDGINAVRATTDAITLPDVFVGVWVAGMVAFALPLLSDVVRRQLLMRRARPVCSDEWTASLEQVRSRLEIARPVRLWEVDEDVIPMTWGILRPVILVAASSSRWHAQRRQLVLLHELAHIRRLDLPLQLLARIVCAAFWFNPLVWYGWHRLRMERELACDDLVLASGVRASDYASELIDIAQSHQPRHLVSAVAMASASCLEDRVRSMLDGARSHAPLTRSGGVGLASAAALVLLTTVILHPTESIAIADEAPDDKTEQSQRAASGKNAATRSTVDSVGDPLPEGALLRLGTLRFRHPSNVHGIALSPDEQSLVTVGDRLFVWDTATGVEKWRSGAGEASFHVNSGYCTQPVAFSADSRRFYSIGRWSEIIVWDTDAGTHEVLSIKFPDPTAPEAKSAYYRSVGENGQKVPHGKASLSVDVSPDGKLLALGSSDGVNVCDRTGKLLYRVANETEGFAKLDARNRDRLLFNGPYSSGRFSPDGERLAVATSDEAELIRLHDAASGEEIRRIKLAARPVQFDFSPDGRRIVVTERDNAVRLYNVDTGEQIWSQIVELDNIYENYTSAVTFTPDGETIAAGATDYRIYLFDAATGDPIGRLSGHYWYPWGLAAAADNKTLYSAGWDGPIRRWDVKAQQQLPLPEGVHATEVAAASPDGRTLAYADDWGTIRLVSADDGRELRTFLDFEPRYSQLAFSPDGRVLAAGGSVGELVQVVLWNVSTGETVHHFSWPKGRDPHSTVNSLSFTQDGTRLAAAVFRQSAAYLWDLTTGKQIGNLGHRSVYGLSFSPDSKTLATAGWNKMVQFWDAGTGQFQRQINVPDVTAGDDLRMYTVCFAPSGEMFATAHLDGSVRVWDADELSVQTQFKVESRFVYGAMSFSPDGLWLATGSQTGEICLWDPLTGVKVWDIGRQQDNMYTVDFGRDSRTLLTAGDDGVAYLWDLCPPDLPSDMSMSELWNDLAGSDSQEAYRAVWGFAGRPEDAVPFLAENLPVELSRNEPIGDDSGQRPETAESSTIARRAVTVLSQIGTADAARWLKTWVNQDPDGLLGKSALGALERASR